MYKTFFCKFNIRLSDRREKLVRFMVVRVEYDRPTGYIYSCGWMWFSNISNFFELQINSFELHNYKNKRIQS